MPRQAALARCGTSRRTGLPAALWLLCWTLAALLATCNAATRHIPMPAARPHTWSYFNIHPYPFMGSWNNQTFQAEVWLRIACLNQTTNIARMVVSLHSAPFIKVSPEGVHPLAPATLLANNGSLPQIWFQSVDDDLAVNATQLINYDELLKLEEDATALILGATLPVGTPFTLRVEGSERVHHVQEQCSPMQHPLFTDKSVWLGLMDATTVKGTETSKVNSNMKSVRAPPPPDTYTLTIGGGSSMESIEALVTALAALPPEQLAALAGQTLSATDAAAAVAAAGGPSSIVRRALLARGGSFEDLLRSNSLASKSKDADSTSSGFGTFGSDSEGSSSGSSSSGADGSSSSSSSSSSSKADDNNVEEALFGFATSSDSSDSSSTTAGRETQAPLAAAAAPSQEVYFPFTGDITSSSSGIALGADNPAAAAPPAAPAPSRASNGVHMAGDYAEISWAKKLGGGSSAAGSDGSSSSSSSTAISTPSTSTPSSSSSSHVPAPPMKYKQKGEIIRFLTLQHLQHHKALGFSGSIMVVTRHTAEQLMQSRPLRRAMQRQRLVLVLWDQGLEPRASHFMQVPTYNLLKLAAWGSKSHLGFWDLDEYLVLPTHRSIVDEVQDGCLTGTFAEEPEAIIPTMWVASNSWNTTPELQGWMQHGQWSRAVQAMDYVMWPYTFCDGACKSLVDPNSDMLFQVHQHARPPPRNPTFPFSWRCGYLLHFYRLWTQRTPELMKGMGYEGAEIPGIPLLMDDILPQSAIKKLASMAKLYAAMVASNPGLAQGPEETTVVAAPS